VVDFYYSYLTYTKVRDASWNFILDCGINSLPVSAFSICKFKGYRLFKDADVNYLRGQSGASFLKNGVWNIIVNDREPAARQRYTVLHEIGHIVFKHNLVNGKYGRTFDNSRRKEEYEAERFAIDVLAPACVLWGIGIHTWQDIKDICGLTMTAAKNRAVRMAELYKRNKFLKSPLERKVLKQFEPFIDEYKKMM
jgi:Zn-dependent peptidase ImmA (M78 family)